MVLHSHFSEDMGPEAVMPVWVCPADTFQIPLFESVKASVPRGSKHPTSIQHQCNFTTSKQKNALCGLTVYLLVKLNMHCKISVAVFC